MPSQSFDVLKAAIQNMQPVKLWYKDKHRSVCPHSVGWDSERREKVLVYQYAGDSKGGLGPLGGPDNWRCLFVSEVEYIDVLDTGVWHTCDRHTKASTCMVRIDAEVPH